MLEGWKIKNVRKKMRHPNTFTYKRAARKKVGSLTIKIHTYNIIYLSKRIINQTTNNNNHRPFAKVTFTNLLYNIK